MRLKLVKCVKDIYRMHAFVYLFIVLYFCGKIFHTLHHFTVSNPVCMVQLKRCLTLLVVVFLMICGSFSLSAI